MKIIFFHVLPEITDTDSKPLCNKKWTKVASISLARTETVSMNIKVQFQSRHYSITAMLFLNGNVLHRNLSMSYQRSVNYASIMIKTWNNAEQYCILLLKSYSYQTEQIELPI